MFRMIKQYIVRLQYTEEKFPVVLVIIKISENMFQRKDTGFNLRIKFYFISISIKWQRSPQDHNLGDLFNANVSNISE